MSTQLFINDTFEALEVPYRLLHTDPEVDAAYVLQLDDPHPFPQRWKLSELQPCKDMPDIFRVIPDPTRVSAPVTPSTDDCAVRDRRWRRIEPVVSKLKKDASLWERENFRQHLRTHAANVGTSEKTLLADMRMWWRGGQVLDALLGGYWKCGRVEARCKDALVVSEKTPNGVISVVFAPAKEKARGRDPEDGLYGKLALTAELREAIYTVAKKHYLEDKTKTIYGATIAVLDEMFSLKDENGEPLREKGIAVLKPPGQRPTFDQIRYFLRKALPVSKAFIERNSNADYDNNHAPSTGSVNDDCLGPADVFEIDATVFDIWLVARANRAVIIGKPTMYLVVDRHTGLIVGFYITLDPPSWAGARQAILSIGQDWEALCNRLGVAYDPRDYPARMVLPNRFFADRGDMISFASDQICEGLSTQVTNAPALASRKKPVVEPSFLKESAKLRQDAAAYEPPWNVKKRQAKKYHKDACYTLDEFAALALIGMREVNRGERMGQVLTPEEILGNASASPIETWNRRVASRMGALARMPVELMRRRMMHKGVAMVRNDGIEFVSAVNDKGERAGFAYKGLVYKHPDPKVLGEWHVRASLRGEFEVKVRYNPSLVDQITVVDKFDSRIEYDLVLVTHSQGYAGYSFAEAEFVMKEAAKKGRAAAKLNEAHAVTTRQDINRVTKPAAAAAKAASQGMTPGMRQAGGDAVRDAEAQERRAANNSFNAEPVQYGHRSPEEAAAEPSAASTTQREHVTTEEAATPASSSVPADAVTDFDPAIFADLFSPESDQ
jgi:putative transposase